MSSSWPSCYYVRIDVARASPENESSVCLCLGFSHILESLLVCASLMLLVGMVILAIKLWKQRSKATSHFFKYYIISLMNHATGLL